MKAARSTTLRFGNTAVLLAALASLTGCFLETDAYYGRYEVSCPEIGPATGWAGAADIPERVAKQLGRPLEDTRSDFPETVRMTEIALPPDPGILFQFRADYRISILVNASDPNEDEATRTANRVIAETLKASPCDTWQFHIGHCEKLFAGRAPAASEWNPS